MTVKMSDTSVLLHLVVSGLLMASFLGLLFSLRLFIRKRVYAGIAAWLTCLVVLGGMVFLIWFEGTAAGGFLD